MDVRKRLKRALIADGVVEPDPHVKYITKRINGLNVHKSISVGHLKKILGNNFDWYNDTFTVMIKKIAFKEKNGKNVYYMVVNDTVMDAKIYLSTQMISLVDNKYLYTGRVITITNYQLTYLDKTTACTKNKSVVFKVIIVLEIDGINSDNVTISPKKIKTEPIIDRPVFEFEETDEITEITKDLPVWWQQKRVKIHITYPDGSTKVI